MENIDNNFFDYNSNDMNNVLEIENSELKE